MRRVDESMAAHNRTSVDFTSSPVETRLFPLGQDARKPIFALTSADGAIGSHSVAAREAYTDFRTLSLEILRRMGGADAL